MPSFRSNTPIKLALVLPLVWLNFMVYAQFSQEKVYANRNELNEDLKYFMPHVLKEVWKGYPLIDYYYEVNELFKPYKDSSELQAKRAILTEELKALQRNLGFSLYGSYSQNFQAAPVLDIDELPYDYRTQIGLKWDFLKGGLFGNSVAKKELKNEVALDELQYSKFEKQWNFPFLYNRIIQNFAYQKWLTLLPYIKSLETKVAIDQFLLANKQITYQATITTQGKLENAKAQEELYLTYFKKMGEVSGHKFKYQYLPLLSVNLDSLKELYLDNQFFEEELGYKKNLASLKHHPLKEISASAYIRYNNLVGVSDEIVFQGITSREYPSVGLNVNIPISALTNASAKKLINAETHLLEIEHKRDVFKQHKEILNYYYNYQQAYQSFIKEYFQLKNLKEKIRQEYAKRVVLDTYSPVKVISLSNEFYESKLKLIHQHESMYLSLLKMYQYTKFEKVEPFTQVELLTHYQQRHFFGIYLWSDDLNRFDQDFMVEYLSAIGVKEVHYSTGKTNDEIKQKSELFSENCRNRNILPTRLIGDNNLILPKNRSKLLRLLNESKTLGFEKVHLDVEPHALNIWPKQDSSLMADYLSMLNLANKECEKLNLQLAVSIPVFYKKDDLFEIYNLVDEVYLMNYGATNLKKIEEKLKEEMSINKRKSHIALSTKDFDSLNELYKSVTSIKSKYPNSKIVLHDLGSLLNLENRTINQQTQ